MAEYIEREAVNALIEAECSPKVAAYLIDAVATIPAADVRPVKWIPVTERLPEMNRRPPSNLLMVREHRLVQPLQVEGRASWVKFSRASAGSREDFSSPASLAARAAP